MYIKTALTVIISCSVISYHFATLREARVAAMLEANERVLECKVREWHCGHLLDGCLAGRYNEKEQFRKEVP